MKKMMTQERGKIEKGEEGNQTVKENKLEAM